jgi:hypothetical protein
MEAQGRACFSSRRDRLAVVAGGYALDQWLSGAKARRDLGWRPKQLDPEREIAALPRGTPDAMLSFGRRSFIPEKVARSGSRDLALTLRTWYPVSLPCDVIWSREYLEQRIK